MAPIHGQRIVSLGCRTHVRSACRAGNKAGSVSHNVSSLAPCIEIQNAFRGRHRQDAYGRVRSSHDQEPGPLSDADDVGGKALSVNDVGTSPDVSPDDEQVFYQGSGSNAELLISLLLGTTLIYLPLTMASIGRRLWVSYKFTTRRVVVTTSSPVLKREVQIEYSKIKEVRSAPRAFGLWGDMVIFLKDGSRLELIGLEKFDELRDFLEGKIQD